MSAFVCGLDVHFESTFATILNADGRVVVQKRMPNELVFDFLKPFGEEMEDFKTSTYATLRAGTEINSAF